MAKKKKAAQAEQQELILGISLAQYAAVNAALAEGLSLQEVLELEGLDARSYPKADLQWKQRLVAAATLSGGLFEQYQMELAAAEDWLARSIVPLDNNPMAWTAFLQAYSASADPGAWLKSLKLGPNDVSRLSRAWAKRVEKDAVLSKQLGELSKSPPGALPALSIAPIQRKRSRVASGGDAPKQNAPAASSGQAGAALEDFGLDRWAALQADLAAFPEARERVLAKYALLDPGVFDALSLRWNAQLHKDPVLNRDYRTLLSHYSNQAKLEGPPSAAPARAQVPQSPVEEAHLAFAPRPAVIEAPAFRGVIAAPLPSTEPAAPAPPEPKPQAGATQDVASLFATGAALPFREGPVVLPPEPQKSKAAPQASGTQDVSALFNADTPLPFGDRASAPPAEAPKPAQKAAGTQDVSAFFSGGAALPFGDRPSGLPIQPEQSQKLQNPKTPPAHQASGTQDVSSLFETGAPLPFEPQTPVKPSPSRPEMPNLSLEQYASLCVELHLGPERADETFGRYGIAREVRASVDAFWQRRLAAEPSLYQAYVQAYNVYKAWLLQRR